LIELKYLSKYNFLLVIVLLILLEFLKSNNNLNWNILFNKLISISKRLELISKSVINFIIKLNSFSFSTISFFTFAIAILIL